MIGNWILYFSFLWVLISRFVALIVDHYGDFYSVNGINVYGSTTLNTAAAVAFGTGYKVSDMKFKTYWDMTVEFLLINIGAGFAPDLWSIVMDKEKKEAEKKD